MNVEPVFYGSSSMDSRRIQELLDHRDVSTTMIDAHGLNCDPLGVLSPADHL